MKEHIHDGKDEGIHFKISIRRKAVDVHFIRDWLGKPSITSHFEFHSDGSVVSETGYRSHFTVERIAESANHKAIAQELAEGFDKDAFQNTENAVLTAWCSNPDENEVEQ